MAQLAIRTGVGGGMGEVADVLCRLRWPFDEQPRFAAPPPDWARNLEIRGSR